MTITTLIFFFIIFMMFLLFKTSDIKERKQIITDLEQQANKLNIIIESRKAIIEKLENEMENKAQNHNYNLNKATMEVLDQYDHSHISIPIEIIEELSFMNIGDKEQIITYIENQRHMWKLEHSKKLMKMDVMA